MYLGYTPKIVNAGASVRTFEFRNLRGGMVSSESVTYGKKELPGMLIHRGAILEALFEALPAGCLHLNAQFQSVWTLDKINQFLKCHSVKPILGIFR